MAAIMPVDTVNVPVVEPGDTVTDAGAVSAPLLLEIATVAPSFRESVTVQLAVAPLPNVAGAQDTPVTVRGALSVTGADCDDPFNKADIIAV